MPSRRNSTGARRSSSASSIGTRPLFNAYSFVQARQQEYEADRVSVDAVGPDTAASALLRVNVQSDFLGEKFWPAVFKRAETDPVPALSPFTMLGLAFTQSNGDPSARNWLSRSLTRRTGYDDTHPCLADRLAAIGVAPFIPDPIATNAADALLGTASEVLQRQMDDHWRAEIKGWWGERHQFVATARARLAELDRQREATPLSDAELWERAQLTEDIVTAGRGPARVRRSAEPRSWARGRAAASGHDPARTR